MVRLRIDKLMERRGISAYALSRGAQISYPSAYRLSRPGVDSAGCTLTRWTGYARFSRSSRAR